MADAPTPDSHTEAPFLTLTAGQLAASRKTWTLGAGDMMMRSGWQRDGELQCIHDVF